MGISKSKEYRKELAEMFAKILEEKDLNWKKEWNGLHNVPVNAVKERKYKGINAFVLMLTMVERGYTDPRFATFNQIKEMGCKLHDAKGMGVRVEYWFPFDRKEKKALTWDEFIKITNGRPDDRYVLHTKYSTVFNAAHIEGLPEREPEKINDISEDELITKLSENMGVEIVNDGGDRAFYRPFEDKIHLPMASAFISDYAYNSTALHELAHSTGAPHRLNRSLGGMFGSESYAYEELIAEITSCFMSIDLNMEQDSIHLDNHKAYIQSWIKSIREKPEMLVKAIAEAEKAAAYMEYKAELIPEHEYRKTVGATMELTENELIPTQDKVISDEYMVAREINETSRDINRDNALPFPEEKPYVYYAVTQPLDYDIRPAVGELFVEDYKGKRFVDSIGTEAYGWVSYNRALTSQEMDRAGFVASPNNARSEVPIRLFLDLDGTAAVFNKVDTLETLYEKGYFANLEPNWNIINAIKIIIRDYPQIEVFSLSAYLTDSKYALSEKEQWMDTYIPEIDNEHRIFMPCGENKLDYLPGGVRKSDQLLDDYTHNLTMWEPPARGIKLLNGINHTRETWRGNRLRYDKSPEELAENIVDIALNGLVIRDIKPQENDLEKAISRLEQIPKELANMNKKLEGTIEGEYYSYELGGVGYINPLIDTNKNEEKKFFEPITKGPKI